MSQQTLAQIVTKTMRENGLSGYDVERHSNGLISQSYINRIKNGQVTNVTPKKLSILEKGLGMPKGTLMPAAFGTEKSNSKTEQLIAHLIDYTVNLPQSVQEDVLTMVKALYKKYAK